MDKIELICVGDLKFDGFKLVEQEYLKKIRFFTKMGIRNLRDVKSTDDSLKIKKEGEMMRSLLEPEDYVVALDENGKRMDSQKFAKFVDEKMTAHPHRIVFLIGGHAGLSSALETRIDFKLSFSSMTFGHDIFRILFLEQLYRAFTIIKKITYHR